MEYDDIGCNAPSSDYFVDTYNTVWLEKAKVRKAVRFERRLELALKGYRVFDLVRRGIAVKNIKAYLQREKTGLLQTRLV